MTALLDTEYVAQPVLTRAEEKAKELRFLELELAALDRIDQMEFTNHVVTVPNDWRVYLHHAGCQLSRAYLAYRRAQVIEGIEFLRNGGDEE
jgi:hypothetical protein